VKEKHCYFAEAVRLISSSEQGELGSSTLTTVPTSAMIDKSFTKFPNQIEHEIFLDHSTLQSI
jgi:hypothetical protein